MVHSKISRSFWSTQFHHSISFIRMAGRLSNFVKKLVGGQLKMDAICIHLCLFTGWDSLPKLLEVILLNEETTETRMLSCNLTQINKYHQDNECPSTPTVSRKRFQLTTSFLFNYQIYVKKSLSPNSGGNNIANIITTS